MQYSHNPKHVNYSMLMRLLKILSAGKWRTHEELYFELDTTRQTYFRLLGALKLFNVVVVTRPRESKFELRIVNWGVFSPAKIRKLKVK